MRVLILSDIHSNAPALAAVLNEALANDPDRVILLGDTFGYYPWATEVWDHIRPLLPRVAAIRGNHDLLMFRRDAPDPAPSYWRAAQMNREQLAAQAPEALEWQETLPCECWLTLDEYEVHLVHGTPPDPVNGRLYPDESREFDWFPGAGEVLLFGHTHYPMVRHSGSGLILNPGSVGQPRDGDPRASWAVWDTATGRVDLMRTAYDHHRVMEQLRQMGWDERSIRSLDKRRPGAME